MNLNEYITLDKLIALLGKVSDLAGFQFWGCDQLVHENKFQKENFGLDWGERIILICACLGDGDYIGIKTQ